MSNQHFYEEEINSDFLEAGKFVAAEYEQCTFIGCHFSKLDLGEYQFIDCEFIECKLDNTYISGTIFSNAIFRRCELLGLRFDRANAMNLSFRMNHCTLNDCVFYQLNLQHTAITDSVVRHCDFTEANLKGADFANSALPHCIFDQSNLENCNFHGATDFVISPVRNKIKKAIFDQNQLEGLLLDWEIVVK